MTCLRESYDGSTLRSELSNCFVCVSIPPTPESVLPHICPLYPSTLERWVLPRQNRDKIHPDMFHPGNRLSPPEEYPGPVGEVGGLSIETESTLIPIFSSDRVGPWFH